MGNPARILLRPFQSRRQRTTTALELSGEWLKLAQVEVGAKGKRLLRLIARPVAPQEELSQTLVDLFKTGMSSADSIVISIPRNLVTVRNLQLPTADPHELKEMIDLQAAKQTPYAKEEIIADFQVVRRSPEGYTDVGLITTHRSVSNRCLKILDDFHLKAAGIRLSSHGVLSSWQLMRGATRDEERGPTAVLDIDSNFSDFLVTRSGAVTFTKALSIGSAKLGGGERDREAGGGDSEGGRYLRERTGRPGNHETRGDRGGGRSRTPDSEPHGKTSSSGSESVPRRAAPWSTRGDGSSRGTAGIRILRRGAWAGLERRERRNRFDSSGGPPQGGPRAQRQSDHGHGDPRRLDSHGPHGSRLPARLFQEAISRAVRWGDFSDSAGGERRGSVEEEAEDYQSGRTARELLLRNLVCPSPEHSPGDLSQDHRF